MMEGAVPDGQYTSTIYGSIKEQKYDEAVRLLTFELQVTIFIPFGQCARKFLTQNLA